MTLPTKPGEWRSPVCVKESTNNAKLGAASVSHVSMHSCVLSCKHHPEKENTCYALRMPQGFTARRLNSNPITDPDQLARLEALELRSLSGYLPLRVHVVGDCTTDQGANHVGGAMVAHARKHGRYAWTYTHAWQLIKAAAWKGARVLASLDHDATRADVTAARTQGYTAFALSTAAAHSTRKPYTDTQTGLRLLPCPAQFKRPGKRFQCSDCHFCQSPEALRKIGADGVAFQPDHLDKA